MLQPNKGETRGRILGTQDAGDPAQERGVPRRMPVAKASQPRLEEGIRGDTQDTQRIRSTCVLGRLYMMSLYIICKTEKARNTMS